MASLFQALGALLRRMTGGGTHALIVEPNPESRALLLTYLKATSVRFDVVESPQEAMAFIERNADAPPHLFIIANKQNGDTGGVETARMLGQIRTVSRTPVIILHERMPEDRLAGFKKALPRAEFVERPFAAKKLQNLVVKLAKRGQKRPAARTSLASKDLSMPPPPRIRSRDGF